MIKTAGRILLAASSAAVLLFSATASADQEPLGRAGSAALPPVVVLTVACLNPGDVELAEPVRATAPDGTAVELWCGDLIEVSRGRCAVRRGDVVTGVPCVRSGATAAGR